ncbi:N-acetyl-gamma-glutamyl-phosphate reductase [Endozoicomonas sp. GU-1]|uniref:N-acetyl-gamma-glutamyl-phosphate reductase n=1 Tax=Endozoicomonas sp. GU-1 TaxID=3009078 RepID=UPI0022B45285|nr:N-acetyl-gamma-glutamyl-phosphate reductase [Endozoicomonas sp. GU-1]WBA80713.1 N-acetyl-gamma-glutamyl-phosphate reductase [Endozoicomonas sp. GU-1]WBA88280.1 N-acetyl-gamma-glutamyl-phosphate reductase [Endozoicomonas sp. GU-1]
MIKVGIVGGTGYTGAELLRLLSVHPNVELRMITSRSEAGKPVSELFSGLRGKLDLNFSLPDNQQLTSCDLVFFATPNGIAMESVPELLSGGVRVIDLAADFRLRDTALWQQWYGLEHACPEVLAEAVYGLPEMNRADIASARLVANPGCYPTATQLGLLPLVRAGLVSGNIIVDAKSGVSGAGRGANVGTLLCEASESFKAYGVAGHRHLPEIRQGLERMPETGVSPFTGDLVFVPHLTPMIRGIHSTLYCTVKDHSIDLQGLYESTFADEPFVDVMPVGSHPETRSVRGCNQCRIAIHRPQGGDTVVILSAIDNLVKGAAGQAVQNMNIMFGLDEITGLDFPAAMP